MPRTCTVRSALCSATDAPLRAREATYVTLLPMGCRRLPLAFWRCLSWFGAVAQLVWSSSLFLILIVIIFVLKEVIERLLLCKPT